MRERKTKRNENYYGDFFRLICLLPTKREPKISLTRLNSFVPKRKTKQWLSSKETFWQIKTDLDLSYNGHLGANLTGCGREEVVSTELY